MTAQWWARGTVDMLRQQLLAATQSAATRVETVRVWELSGVERLTLSSGTTVIFKFAVEPFTQEGRILNDLAGAGVPVVTLRAWAIRDRTLGMLMEDRGEVVRQPTETDAASAAVRLHTAPPLPYLETFDEETLRSLPERGLALLANLKSQGRFLGARDIARALQDLAAVAKARVAGAELPPYGVCHGELHPTSLHVGEGGVKLLDLAKAFNGPGLLDLATWLGTRRPADPHQMDHLIRAYQHAGGPNGSTIRRGGLPPAHWALGWHRLWAANWFLTHLAAGRLDRTTDEAHQAIVRRQTDSAAALMNQP